MEVQPELTYEYCSKLRIFGAKPKADPEVSGGGVVLAFLISAYVTFGAVLAGYVFGLVERPMLNTVDRHIFGARSYSGKHPQLHGALRKLVLALSDQQIVTGIAIMAAGFQGLRNGAATSYHYQVILYLAWMSSSVHLSALTLLRPYLWHHPGIRAWRILGMSTLLLLLLIGLMPTTSNDWGVQDPAFDGRQMPGLSGWYIPARCFWFRLYQDGVNPDAVLSFFLLVVSYLWKFGDLMTTPRSLYNRGIRSPVDRWLEGTLHRAAHRYMASGGVLRLWLFRVILVFYLHMLMVFETAASFSASLWISALGLAFGTQQIVIPRYQALHDTAAEESRWGFGQLVPLILLIQPLGAMSEVLWLPADRRGSLTVLDESDFIPSACFDALSPFILKDRVEDPNEPFISVMAHKEPLRFRDIRSTNPAEMLAAIRHHRMRRHDYLFHSRTFRLLAWMLQAEILLGSTTVLCWDAFAIGYRSAGAWFVCLLVIPAFTSLSLLIALCLCPFSRLGRDVIRKPGS